MATFNDADLRDFATVDIPGAFLSSSLSEDEITHMVFRGWMADFDIKTDPNYMYNILSKNPTDHCCYRCG